MSFICADMKQSSTYGKRRFSLTITDTDVDVLTAKELIFVTQSVNQVLWREKQKKKRGKKYFLQLTKSESI